MNPAPKDFWKEPCLHSAVLFLLSFLTCKSCLGLLFQLIVPANSTDRPHIPPMRTIYPSRSLGRVLGALSTAARIT